MERNWHVKKKTGFEVFSKDTRKRSRHHFSVRIIEGFLLNLSAQIMELNKIENKML